MFKEVLQSISELSLLSVTALLLFFVTFSGVVVWVLLMDKKKVERMARLPLEDDVNTVSYGEEDHGGV